jgi:hypothetical protein
MPLGCGRLGAGINQMLKMIDGDAVREKEQALREMDATETVAAAVG